MDTRSLSYFYAKVHNKKRHFPHVAHLELTYRCNLDCIYCYCKGSEDRSRELTTQEWKKIIFDLRKEGCLWLTLTGGEPLLRDDFLDIYSYAKRQGFIVNIFTNGLLFNKKIIDHLVSSPPSSIDITLNGITKGVYERITQVDGSFVRIMRNLKVLTKNRLPVLLKTNALRQNWHQMGRIKTFAEKILERPTRHSFCFKFDTMVYPRLNGDNTPISFRLSAEEITKTMKTDPDFWREYERNMHFTPTSFPLRKGKHLYHCNSWKTQVFINPYAEMKMCPFSHKFKVDLKKVSIREGFYKIFPQALRLRFKTESKCKMCRIRHICYYCPPRAFLETGNEESPVGHYCHLAKSAARQIPYFRNKIKHGKSKLFRLAKKAASKS